MMKESPRAESQHFDGLCGSCRLASDCKHRKSQQRPVLQCAEFEGFPCTPRRVSVEAAVAQSTASPKADPVLAAEYAGLCGNCRHLESCTFPKPAGGVWRCEEYE